jgi:CRISPR/Cas system CSM-associated protein Csm4 (group 5 of RAMP superfamily)
MSVEEFKEQCQKFISNLQAQEDWNKKISQMTLEEFQQWNKEMLESYYSCYEIVKELIKQIRGDYDPLKDYDSDKEDPLKEEDNQKFFRQYRDTFENIYQQFIDSMPAFAQKQQELKDYRDAEAQERLLNIEVDGKKFKALKAIEVLWSGWECDGTAWIVEDQGQKRLVASNHGELYFADKDFLEEKMKEYKEAIAETENALAMLK